MSSRISPTRREKAQSDESHLPKGECRYILLHPAASGLRCACVGFTLNISTPGSTCNCAHQACYHTPEKENVSVGRHELETLREKVMSLEEELNRERHGGRGGMIDRLGRLEELVDTTKAESETELRNVHRRMHGVWEHIGNLHNKSSSQDDHIESLVDDVQRMRDQLEEVDDASMAIENKIDALENSIMPAITPKSQRRKASTPALVLTDSADKSEDSNSLSKLPLRRTTVERPTHQRIQLFHETVGSLGSGAQSWTVHISLLPTSAQPFAFEKDTSAYKRCLSRGLHQVIVVPDSNGLSFKMAVDDAFSKILRGRPWEPLMVRSCDPKNLQGLPMLRRLENPIVGCTYDPAFLQKNCAACDESGRILDIYIAMSEGTISWPELKKIDPFKPGLEESWTYDPHLDGPGSEDTQDPEIVASHPATGDLLPSWPSSLKRNAAEISRTASFGTSPDGEAARAKLQRQYTGATVEVVGRRAEAV